MRSLKLALLASAAVAVLSSAAFAADLVVDTPVAPVVDNSFNWDGAYIGAFLQGSGPAPSAFGIGADLGVNALMDNIVVGGQIEGAIGTAGSADGELSVHAGGLISDTALIYVYTGAGSRTFTSWYVPLGVGVEFAVADNLGLKAEAQYNFDLTSSAQNSAAVKVGLNWHF
jgi:opacity protein-like surface antigen